LLNAVIAAKHDEVASTLPETAIAETAQGLPRDVPRVHEPEPLPGFDAVLEGSLTGDELLAVLSDREVKKVHQRLPLIRQGEDVDAIRSAVQIIGSRIQAIVGRKRTSVQAGVVFGIAATALSLSGFFPAETRWLAIGSSIYAMLVASVQGAKVPVAERLLYRPFTHRPLSQLERIALSRYGIADERP
jgi:hypothetical protein